MPEDVTLLVDREIIVHHLDSDKHASDLFTVLSKDVVFDFNGKYYLRPLCLPMEAHYRSRLNRWISWLWVNHFSNPWLALAALGTVLVLICTIVQTILTVLACVKPLDQKWLVPRTTSWHQDHQSGISLAGTYMLSFIVYLSPWLQLHADFPYPCINFIKILLPLVTFRLSLSHKFIKIFILSVLSAYIVGICILWMWTGTAPPQLAALYLNMLLGGYKRR